MLRAKCRCGHSLRIPSATSERVVCPGCGARVRVRRSTQAEASDGYIRFHCPCGRRLKVPMLEPPKYGRCPDCDRIVPVPIPSPNQLRSGLAPGHPESPTEEMNQVDIANLDRWSLAHRKSSNTSVGVADGDPNSTDLISSPAPRRPQVRAEVGLRVCPRCQQPVHMGSEICRDCGITVPRR